MEQRQTTVEERSRETLEFQKQQEGGENHHFHENSSETEPGRGRIRVLSLPLNHGHDSMPLSVATKAAMLSCCYCDLLPLRDAVVARFAMINNYGGLSLL